MTGTIVQWLSKPMRSSFKFPGHGGVQHLERYHTRRVLPGFFWILIFGFFCILILIISYASDGRGFYIIDNYLHYHHDSKWSTWSKDHHRWCDSPPDHFIHHSESFGFFSGEEKKSWGTRHLMIPSMKYLFSVKKYDKTGSPPDWEWVEEPDY